MPETRLALLLAVPAVTVAVVIAAVLAVVGLPLILAVLVGLGIAVAVAVLLYRISPGRALASLDAHPLDTSGEPRLDNLFDALCENNGFDHPEILRVASAARNSAVAAHGSTATLVFTDGLLQALDYMGLEALLAHQLSVAQQPDLGYRTRVIGLLSMVPAGLQRRLASALLDQPEVFVTDIEGARLTRYPPGQIELLEVLAAGDPRVGGVSEVAAGLWLVNPHGTDADVETHPPLSDRVALQREL